MSYMGCCNPSILTLAMIFLLVVTTSKPCEYSLRKILLFTPSYTMLIFISIGFVKKSNPNTSLWIGFLPLACPLADSPNYWWDRGSRTLSVSSISPNSSSLQACLYYLAVALWVASLGGCVRTTYLCLLMLQLMPWWMPYLLPFLSTDTFFCTLVLLVYRAHNMLSPIQTTYIGF